MEVRGLVVVAVAWASACARPPCPRAPLDYFDPEGRMVRRVEILGNEAHSDGEIADLLALRIPHGFGARNISCFDRLAFELDRRRVQAFYRAHGYFDVELVGSGAEDVGYESVGIWYRVREGKPTRIASVALDGARGLERIDEAELLAETRLRAGDVFVHPTYLEAKRRIHRALVAAGYAHAQVRGVVEVDRDRRLATIELRVDAGPLVRFGETDASEITTVPRSTILARLDWERGDRFDSRKLERTQQRIRALGFLAAIRIDYERDERPAVSDVTLHGRPALLHEARIGGGAAADLTIAELRARAGYSVKQWPSALSTLRFDSKAAYLFYVRDDHERSDVDLELESLSYEAAASLEQLDLLGLRTKWTFTLAFDRRVAEAYTTSGPRLLAGVEYPLAEDRLLLAGRFQAARLDLDPDDATLAAGLGVDDPIRLAFVELSGTWDTRDHQLDARRGGYLNLAAETGAAPLFVRATLEGRYYLAVHDRIVLAARAKGGLLTTLEEGEPAPLTRRYYSGGASSHRGFSFRRLSPSIPDDAGVQVPIGGSALVEASTEARFDVLRVGGQWLGLTLFVDAGDVTSELDQLSASNLHVAVGLGARYDTPLGPFRFDAGVRVTRTAAGEPDADAPYAFHISFGEAF